MPPTRAPSSAPTVQPSLAPTDQGHYAGFVNAEYSLSASSTVFNQSSPLFTARIKAMEKALEQVLIEEANYAAMGFSEVWVSVSQIDDDVLVEPLKLGNRRRRRRRRLATQSSLVRLVTYVTNAEFVSIVSATLTKADVVSRFQETLAADVFASSDLSFTFIQGTLVMFPVPATDQPWYYLSQVQFLLLGVSVMTLVVLLFGSDARTAQVWWFFRSFQDV